MSDVEMRGGTFDADGNKTDHAAVALHVGTADAAPGDVEGLLLVDGVYKMPKTPAHHNRSDDVDPSHPKNGRTRVSKIDIKKEGSSACCHNVPSTRAHDQDPSKVPHLARLGDEVLLLLPRRLADHDLQWTLRDPGVAVERSARSSFELV